MRWCFCCCMNVEKVGGFVEGFICVVQVECFGEGVGIDGLKCVLVGVVEEVQVGVWIFGVEFDVVVVVENQLVG